MAANTTTTTTTTTSRTTRAYSCTRRSSLSTCRSSPVAASASASVFFFAFVYIVFLLSNENGGIAATVHPAAYDAFESVTVLETKLPKPMSDFTATLVFDGGGGGGGGGTEEVEETLSEAGTAASDKRLQREGGGGGSVGGAVYLAGGCDDPNGNVFNDDNGEFNCFSVSSAMYRFDVKTERVTRLPDLPSERYRHAAVLVGDRIWLSGGRDVRDDIVSRIDVYDIGTGTWTNFTDLPTEFYASDHAGFAHHKTGEAYFAGGYDAEYGWLDTVYAVDTEASLASGNLSVAEKAPLLLARGDLSAVTDDGNTYAVVGGGFGPVHGWCEQAPEVERYNFTTDTWSEIAPMRVARSDMALVELNQAILAFGGEKQVWDICERAGVPDPGEQTIAVDDVEELKRLPSTSLPSSSTANEGYYWRVLSNLHDHRFRLAAVAIDAENTVYTFGGQLAYNPDCRCYRASDEITAYVLAQEETPPPAVSPSGAGSRSVRTIAVFSSVLFEGLLSYYW